MDDLRWDVGVVGNGGWDVHPARPHVLPTTSLLSSSHALQHTSSMFPIRVLRRKYITITTDHFKKNLQRSHKQSQRNALLVNCYWYTTQHCRFVIMLAVESQSKSQPQSHYHLAFCLLCFLFSVLCQLDECC